MAKDRSKQFEDEARLINMSAESAKKLASNFKSSSSALQDVIDALNEVEKEIDNSNEKGKTFKDHLKETKSFTEALGDSLGNNLDKLDQSGTLSSILKGNLKETATFSNMAAAGNAAMVATLIKGITQLDKIQTAYNKQFGLTDKQAQKVQARIGDIARESGRTEISFLDVQKAIIGISDATGILASSLRSDVLEEAAELQKLLGLSNEQMATLALNAQKTGQNMEQQSLEMVRGVMAAEDMLGVNLDVNKAFKEAASVSGLIRANLGRSFEEITRVVAKAQAFGLTLKDLAGISSNLLDFQSSIEAELTAELFIGRQLNLEKARLFALTGDYENLQKEIVGQLGSEFEFLKMNVMQREKFAAAMGMSADQLSDMIFKQGDLNSMMEEAERRGETDLLNQLKQQDMQAKFNDLIVKMQTTFVDIANGPIGKFVSFLSDALSSTTGLVGALTLIGSLKMAGLINSIAQLVVRMKILKASTIMTRGLMFGLAGAAIMGGILLALGALSKGSSANPEDTIPMKRYENLGSEEMVTLERGSAIFDQGESVVRTENFGKMNDTLNKINESINNQKLDFAVETHHATRYR